MFSDDIKEQLKNILAGEIIKNPTCKFYLGGYGDFDGLCLHTLKDLKNDFPEIELIFITPYLDKNYSKLEFAKYHYDDVIFPPLERVPRKFAILKRNEWMVNEADLVIAHANVPIQTVSRYMGHSDSTITLEVYSHFIPDTQERALTALDNITG